MIAEPFEVAPENEICAPLLIGNPEMVVGGVGRPAGVPCTPVDPAEDPAALIARTVNVYAVPLVSPVTSTSVDEVVITCPPGAIVTS